MDRREEKQSSERKNRGIKGLKWITVTLFISFFMLAIAVFATEKSEASADRESATEKVVSKELYPGLNLQTTTKDTYFYSTSISQPVTEDDAINQEVNQWVNQEVTKFVLAVEKRRNTTEDQDFHGQLAIETEVTEIADNLYSLVLESSGVNNRKEIKPFIVDLTINKILKAEDIFELELADQMHDLFQEDIHNELKIKDYTIDYLPSVNKEGFLNFENTIDLGEEFAADWEKNKEIKELVLAEMKKNAEFNSYLFEDLSQKALANPDNWRLSVNPEAVTFYFNQYEIAKGAAGTIKADIPMSQLQKYVNIEIFEKLGMDIPQEKLQLEPGGKYIALTFDDGPHPTLTPRVLKMLKEYNAKATFFMGGHQAEYNPDIVKEMKENGHELGDHTLNHLQLSTLSDAQIREQISESSRRIEEAGGARPTVMRPPYGDFDERVERITKEMDLPIIMWSVDSLDWKNRNPQAVINKIMPAVTPGGIVLMHDIHETTADAVPELLHLLKNEGYEFVTVSQLINLWGNEKGHVYFGSDSREMNLDQ